MSIFAFVGFVADRELSSLWVSYRTSGEMGEVLYNNK
jgi:hypothetical protein